MSDILTDIDLDETAPPALRYATRNESLVRAMEKARAEYKADPYDFETAEIERLTGQVLQLQGRLDAIRTEWHMVHATCPVPVFVREWTKNLERLITAE